jgi:demethylmenaquinone methyltransferase/2-methoxy-6-polyprenyl-1,4-benzoquinol methylase
MTTTAQKPETVSPGKVAGTRPIGARDEREAATRVRDMFAHIAPRYDFLNHLLSFSLDRVWRWSTAKRFRHILARPDARVLDICCGTGDLSFALDRMRRAVLPKSQPQAFPVIGSDFVEPMLTRAREKAERGGQTIPFTAADALHLPFGDASFDLLTTAFGFRNLANYEDGLREIARVLKPGGEVGILEFTEPASGPMAGLFRFYFQHILPRIGGVISGNSEAYKYLPGSVAKFPSPPDLAALMEKVGFSGVRFTSWNFGSVVLHSARRNAAPSL